MRAAKKAGKMEEGTQETSTGRVHRGSYGTEFDVGDDGTKKKKPAATGEKRGRGRPKKAPEAGKYDFSAFGATGKKIKLPAHKGAVTRHTLDEGISDISDEQYNQVAAWAKSKGIVLNGLGLNNDGTINWQGRNSGGKSVSGVYNCEVDEGILDTLGLSQDAKARAAQEKASAEFKARKAAQMAKQQHPLSPMGKSSMKAAQTAWDEPGYRGGAGRSTMSEGEKSVAELKAEIKRISDQIDKIVQSGGKVTLTDPLSVKIKHLRSKLKKAQAVTESAAPGQEAWVKKNKQRFIDQYGKDKGLSILYATSWKRSKKQESMDEGTEETSTGRVHKGTYGREFDTDREGNPIVKKAPPAERRGRGRPKKDPVANKYDWSAFGGKVKLPKHTGPVTQHKMVGESVVHDHEGNTLRHIVNTYRRDIKDFLRDGDPTSELWDALYDYYSPDMPYGVAKARTGDPVEWVFQRLVDDLERAGISAELDEEIRPEMIPAVHRKAAGKDFPVTKQQLDAPGDNLSDIRNLGGDTARKMAAQDDMHELDELARLAGLSVKPRPAQVMVGEEEAEYANAPDEEYQGIDSIIDQGEDMNRQKKQFADKPKAGDNPMATAESIDPLATMGRNLMQEYEAMKIRK